MGNFWQVGTDPNQDTKGDRQVEHAPAKEKDGKRVERCQVKDFPSKIVLHCFDG